MREPYARAPTPAARCIAAPWPVLRLRLAPSGGTASIAPSPLHPVSGDPEPATDSNHALEVYLNLSRRMRLHAVDQLWVADITYIRLQAEFVYLAVILDGYS